MTEPIRTSDKFYVALNNKRDVVVTPPWFAKSKNAYPPRPGNVVQPLINGERAFAAVYEAINNAKKTVDIISWGFDPSMRLLRPNGERLGELLRRKADCTDPKWGWRCGKEAEAKIRILIWKDAIGNLGENNMPGDGLFGSGGTALGSGTGSGSAGGGSNAEREKEFNDYANKYTNSAAVAKDDDDAARYNREWFRNQPSNMQFRTRKFSTVEKHFNAAIQLVQRGVGTPLRTGAVSIAATHHQKMILIDYESPEDAIGFVMGHNLLRNYWDTDAHDYFSALRHGFAPWQDLSCRVFGPVLSDLDANFTQAWEAADGWFGGNKFFDSDERKRRKAEDFSEPAKRHGKRSMAQICRTYSPARDFSIKNVYEVALANARQYLYFENQYFRHKEFADLMRTVRRRLKAAGWNRDFHVFVVTNVPPDVGKAETHKMLQALGKGATMPKFETKAQESSKDRELRKSDLDGVNIHVCTLEASMQTAKGANYHPIYVHSKLLLVDDVFFTLGSANINVRSMEADTELNIASPSPEVAQQWRQHLWKLHTGQAPGEDMAVEFERWAKIMVANQGAKKFKQALAAPLIEFFDGEPSAWAWD